MKVYFVYIHNLPDKIYNEMDGSVFLPKLEMDKNNNTWTGFYGFTKNKKILNEFMDVHDKKYFIIKSKKITKDEYFKFKKENLGYLISLNKYRVSKTKICKIATTNNEHMHSEEDYEDIIFNKLGDAYSLIISVFENFDYRMFNDKYRDLLEKLFIGTYMDMLSGDESKEDQASYNMSFGKTSDGNYDFKIMINTFNVFISIYYKILKK